MKKLDSINLNDLTMRFAYKLKLYREFSNFNQAHMAHLLSISHRTYQRIEAGETNIDIGMALKIATILDIPLNKWISLEPIDHFNSTIFLKDFDENQINEEDQQLINLYKNTISIAEVQSLMNHPMFLEESRPMFLSINSKKVNNIKLSQISENDSNKFLTGYEDPRKMIDALDWVNFHRPEKSIIKKTSLITNDGKNYISYYLHKYFDNNIVNLCILFS